MSEEHHDPPPVPNFLTTSWNPKSRPAPPPPAAHDASDPPERPSGTFERVSGNFEKASGNFERALLEINSGGSKASPETGVRPPPSEENVDLWRDLTRVPFSIWVFLMGFLIFRLFTLAGEIQQDANNFELFIFNSCVIVQNATNDLINLHKTVANDTIGGIADLADKASSTGFTALYSVVNLTSELVMLLIDVATEVPRCTSIAAATLATDFYLDSNKPAMEQAVQQDIALGTDPFNNAIEGFNAELHGPVTNAINSFVSSYNNVSSQLQAHFIPLPPLSIDLSQITGVEPSIIVIPSVNLPNSTSWTPPDYSAIINGFFDSLDPQQSLDALVAQIPEYQTTGAQLIAQMNLTQQLQTDELYFCEEINFEAFRTVSNTLLTAVWGTAAALCVLLALMVFAEASIVVYHHKKGSLRPAWFPEGGTLDTFIKYIWYKPSVTCLLVGILGIAIFKGLESAVQEAKVEFEIDVIAGIRNYSITTLANLDQDLDEISQTFAGLVNTQIDDFVGGIDTLRNNVNNTLNDIVNIQDLAKGYLDQYVGGIDPIAGPALVGMAECMFSFLNLPVEDIVNLIPSLDNMPRIAPDLLTFNMTQAELIVNETLSKATYPFDDYTQKLEDDAQFFYYLAAYGAPVFLFGFAFALWDLAMNAKVKR